ncbi:non-homologous end joining protein Ku [Streptomyces sp. NBC_00316]|uniref:non-homologous end joining protein Ku n=1 Tax=Streptomyces sp. NBC_00316 TaxID=2975710 RepID=UPI002E29C89E|nr:Ku protein [Streptomyces sp. NBC_00316]
MRALRSGVIQFGLVVLPVKLLLATEEHQVQLREIHAADSGRVQHRRFCEAEDREIPYEEVGRGWELPDGRLVPLTDEDLECLPLATRHVVEVLGFVPGQDVDPISYSRPYYVGPGGPPADRPYALLVEALACTGQAGVCKVAIRSREHIALLRPRHGILILQTLLWQDELRDPGDLTPSTPVTNRELELAEALMRELTGVEVDQLQDDYQHALEQLVEAKVSGGQLAAPPEPGPAMDLMAALEESVRTAHAHQGS